jgi:putative colanic acid biosynthesis acetyltransferase WcaF
MRLNTFDNSSFSRGVSRSKEMIWWMVRSALFAPWFPIPSILKVIVLRIFGARVGKGVVVRSRVNITFPWRLEIGDHVWIGEEVFILNLAKVTIGSHTCVSQRAFLCTGSHDFRSDAFDLVAKPLKIGQGCWVAANVFIGPGVTLQEGTICLAGAVVLVDAGPNQIMQGNPAMPRENNPHNHPI